MPTASFLFDGIFTGGAAAAWLGLKLAMPQLGRPSCPCRRDEVNGFDRPVVDWTFSAGTELSSITAGVAIAAPLLALWGVAPGIRPFLSDALLVLESAAVAGLITQGVKIGLGRPYPYMYRDPTADEIGDGSNYASLWSGHTASPMAAAITAAYLFQRRRPHSPWRWVMWFAGPAAAIAAGMLQVSEGNHFFSDVIAGAAFGAAIGVAVPWLHELL